MAFADRLKAARRKAGLTQVQLAELSGVSARAIQTWEKGTHPKSVGIVHQVAEVLNMTTEELLDETDQYIVSAYEKGGAKAAKDIQKMVDDMVGLFAGGEIDDEEKEGIMAVLNEAYWEARMKAKNAKK